MSSRLEIALFELLRGTDSFSEKERILDTILAVTTSKKTHNHTSLRVTTKLKQEIQEDSLLNHFRCLLSHYYQGGSSRQK